MVQRTTKLCAVLDHTRVDVTAKRYVFRATGAVMRFPGFTTLYEEAAPEMSKIDEDTANDNRTLPPLEVGQMVQATTVTPSQHFTQPPPRFTEASLMSELEKLGIGRPSTYATILSTLRDRNYVHDQQRKLVPTEVGKTVNALLIECFPALLDVQFTAQLEDKLDKIEEGQYQWVETLQNFYTPFAVELDKATHQMRNVKREVEATDETCDQCQRPMVIRWGRFGRFLVCTGFPDCTHTRELATDDASGQPSTTPAVEARCERCGRQMVVKRGRYGEFLACTGYPDCKTTRPVVVVMACPEKGCNGDIVHRRSRRGRTFYGCTNYPHCTFSAWQRPVPKACPHCQAPYLLEKRASARGNGHTVWRCAAPTCDYSETVEATSVA